MKQTPLRILSIAAIIALLALLPAFAQPVTKQLADGVTFTQDINTDSANPMVVNVIKVDPKTPGVRITAALGGDTVCENDPTKGREVISRLVARKGAVAGVNADFFPWTGDPLGLAIMNGELVSEPMNRAAVGITASGRVLIDRISFDGLCKTASGLTYPLRGINRERGKTEMVLFTPIYGQKTGAMDGSEVTLSISGPIKADTDIIAAVQTDPAPASGTAIPVGGAILSASGGAESWLKSTVKAGDKLTFRLGIRSSTGTSWDGVVESVGGGPWLVKNGQVAVDSVEESFKPDIVVSKHPRTAAGVTPAGDLLLITVDGRQAISSGVTLHELACVMLRYGAVQAMNLDGGGSTTLAVKGIVVNSPSGGGERPVADALLVYANIPTKPWPDMKLVWRDEHQLQLTDTATGSPASDDVLAGVVWGASGGVGFVNQKGYFTPLRDGTGKVIAQVGGKRLELPVTIAPTQPQPGTPGLPAKLAAQIVIDPARPNGGLLVVTVTDAKGGAVPNIPVTVTITGGTTDVLSRNTNAHGQAVFPITPQTDLDKVTAAATAAGLSADAK